MQSLFTSEERPIKAMDFNHARFAGRGVFFWEYNVSESVISHPSFEPTYEFLQD